MADWMMREMLKQGNMQQAFDAFEPAIEKSCKEIKEQGKDRKIFITGCGDCYYIGLAVQALFRKICKGAVYVYPSLDFSQYGIDLVDADSTVICISMSGKTARSRECMLKAQAKGAVVLGLTNSKEGLLYQQAQQPIFLALPVEETWTCGTLITTGSLYALYKIAIELSDVPAEEKAALLKDLSDTYHLMAEVLQDSRAVCEQVGRNMWTMRNPTPFYILGAGPNFATAKFGAAKYMEVASCLGLGQESEEFCHGELWAIGKTNYVTILAPSGPSFKRTREVALALRSYGCDLFVLSDDEDLCNIGKYAFRMPACNDLFSPLLYCLPLEYQAYYYSYASGLDPDTRKYIDPFKLKTSHTVIRNSELDL